MNKDKFKGVFGNEYSDLYINATFRDCVEGELLQDSMCKICVPGTYTFEAGAKTCETCVNNAICNGGTNLSINTGFWRSNVTTVNLI